MTTPRHHHGSTSPGPDGNSAEQRDRTGGTPGPIAAAPADRPGTSPLFSGRAAGVLYLIVIVFSFLSEAVRSGLVIAGDAAATAAGILDSPWLLRLGFTAALVYILGEVALTIILYLLLRPASMPLSLLAAAFRLISIAIYAVNLLNTFAALRILEQAPSLGGLGAGGPEALALLHLDLHVYGFAVGLTFFAMNCLAMGALLVRSAHAPSAMGVLLGVAGVGYLISSFLYFLLPGYDGSLLVPLLAPALVAETWLCLWLLRRDPRPAS